MIKHKIDRQPDNTIKINLTIPWSKIQEEKEAAFKEMQKTLEVEGFRKGNVPESIARKKIADADIYNKAINKLIPEVYEDIIKKEKLKPIISPKLDLTKADKEKDWEVEIQVAESPVINVDGYKKIIEDLKKDEKAANIWIPGKESEKKDGKNEDYKKKQAEKANKIIETLLSKVDFNISSLIIEEELSNKLSALLDDIKKMGLTVDSYLKSKKLTMDKLKEDYRKDIIDMYKFEFMLMEIADKEKINVGQKEMDDLLADVKDKAQKQKIMENMYVYMASIRKQKTIEYLTTL